MATCKRCEGRRMEPTILPDENGVWRRGEMSCGACKGTGEVEDMKMIRICKTFDFDAAHRLDKLPANHKCHRMHGHTYRADLELAGELDEMGMVIDYAKIAEAWDSVHEAIDHRILNDVPGLECPTTEVLCRWIYDRLKFSLTALVAVTVHESSTTWAEYRP